MTTQQSILPIDNGNFHFETELYAAGRKCVVGVDEAGRGPLAGPVVAACVSLPVDCDPTIFADSKTLSKAARPKLKEELGKIGATMGVGVVSHRRIDQLNILQASLLAMKLAVFHHSYQKSLPDYVLVDGTFEIPLLIDQLPLKKGETKSGSIAAASIVAKVYRDHIMETLHSSYPQYGFAANKGYPTKAHREALARFGPSPFHRLTFKGVRERVA